MVKKCVLGWGFSLRELVKEHPSLASTVLVLSTEAPTPAWRQTMLVKPITPKFSGLMVWEQGRRICFIFVPSFKYFLVVKAYSQFLVFYVTCCMLIQTTILFFIGFILCFYFTLKKIQYFLFFFGMAES